MESAKETLKKVQNNACVAKELSTVIVANKA